METLKGLLDKEFERLSVAGLGSFATGAARAEFLGISPGHFSQILSGNQVLTRNNAGRFSARLYASDPERARSFADQLRASTVSRPGKTHSVKTDPVAEKAYREREGLLQALSRPDALLVISVFSCEYPLLTSDRLQTWELARRLRRPIASGLTVAIVQPSSDPRATEVASALELDIGGELAGLLSPETIDACLRRYAPSALESQRFTFGQEWLVDYPPSDGTEERVTTAWECVWSERRFAHRDDLAYPHTQPAGFEILGHWRTHRSLPGQLVG